MTWQETQQSVSKWLGEMAERLPEGREGVPVKEAYNVYFEWAIERGCPIVGLQEFSKHMRELKVFKITTPKAIFRIRWRENPELSEPTSKRAKPKNEPERVILISSSPIPYGHVRVTIWEAAEVAKDLARIMTEGRVAVEEYIPSVHSLTGPPDDVLDVLEAISLTNNKFKYMRGEIEPFTECKDPWPLSEFKDTWEPKKFMVNYHKKTKSTKERRDRRVRESRFDFRLI